MKPHLKALIKGASIMLGGITAVAALSALIWYATQPRRYEYRVLY